MDERLKQQLDSALAHFGPTAEGWRKIQNAAAIRRKKLLAMRAIGICVAYAAAICAIAYVGSIRGAVFPPATVGKNTQQSHAISLAMLALKGKIYYSAGSLNEKPSLDAQIAVVEYGLSEQDRGIPAGRVYSNVLSTGTPVYAYNGYNPEFRVCAEEGGRWRVFQRGYSNDLPNLPVGELLNIKGKVWAIALADNNGEEIGRIDDPEDVDTLVGLLLTQGSFVKYERGNQKINRRLLLYLKDGTKLEGSYIDGYAGLVSCVKLPPEFADAINSLDGVSAGVPLNAMGGGLTVGHAYGRENALPGLVIDVVDDNILYACWWGWLGEWLQVDAGPVRDVQMEGDTIWFIAADNSIRRLQCSIKDFNEFNDVMGSPGGSMEDYLPVKERIPGNYRHIRVWRNSLVTLDNNGVLALDGNVLSKNVKLMDVDHDGIVYADANAAYRWENGTIKKLVDGSFTAIGSMGHSILVSDMSGIRRISYRSGKASKLSERKASKLICDGSGGIWFIEKETNALYFLDPYGKEQKIRQQGVLDFGLFTHSLVLTVEEKDDGSITMFRITMPQPGGEVWSREELIAKK